MYLISVPRTSESEVVDFTWSKDIKCSIKVVLVNVTQHIQRLIANLSVDAHDHDQESGAKLEFPNIQDDGDKEYYLVYAVPDLML